MGPIRISQSEFDALNEFVDNRDYTSFYNAQYNMGSTIAGLYISGPTGQGTFGKMSHNYSKDVLGALNFEKNQSFISATIADQIIDAIRESEDEHGNYYIPDTKTYLQEEIIAFETMSLAETTEWYAGHALIKMLGYTDIDGYLESAANEANFIDDFIQSAAEANLDLISRAAFSKIPISLLPLEIPETFTYHNQTYSLSEAKLFQGRYFLDLNDDGLLEAVGITGPKALELLFKLIQESRQNNNSAPTESSYDNPALPTPGNDDDDPPIKILTEGGDEIEGSHTGNGNDVLSGGYVTTYSNNDTPGGWQEAGRGSRQTVTYGDVYSGDPAYGSADGRPVVLDLNDNGVEVTSSFTSSTFFDIDGDGFLEQTSWAATDDGFLVIDLAEDGLAAGEITDGWELAFGLWTEADDTDLEALAAVFDTNDDGKLTSADTRWGEFRVWQDLDQDGVTDAGELETLAERGITEVGLTYDDGSVYSNRDDDLTVLGNTLHGVSSFVMNGETIEGGVGDVTLAYNVEGWRRVDTDDGYNIEFESGATFEYLVMDGSGLNDRHFSYTNYAGVTGDTRDNILSGIDRTQGASISGLGGNDYIRGTMGDDQISGDAGADRLAGNEGNDVIFFDADDTEVTGGEGYDIAIAVEFFETDDAGTVTTYAADVSLDLQSNSFEAAYGGDGNDDLFVSSAFGVSVALHGGAGNDTLSGGASDDNLSGDDGDDRLLANGGDDVLIGGNGIDEMHAGSGSDFLMGGSENDSVLGGSGDDFLLGGGGEDFMRGNDGDDYLEGGEGNDNLRGDAGDDFVQGGDGNDTINGGDGDDELLGGAGDDTFEASHGDDFISGGDGDDAIYTGDVDGVKVIFGGLGDDTLYLDQTSGFFGVDTISGGGTGQYRIVASYNTDIQYMISIIDVERIVYSDGAIRLLAGASAEVEATDYVTDTEFSANNMHINYLSGNYGIGDDRVGSDDNNGNDVDVVDGGSGNDTVQSYESENEYAADNLTGGSGDDELRSGGGNDTVNGGSGNDEILGGDGNDFLNGESGSDLILGESGNDEITGGEGDDNLLGGTGDDNVDGGEGADIVLGGEGNDTITGGAGADRINGGHHNDDVDGGHGDDVISDFGYSDFEMVAMIFDLYAGSQDTSKLEYQLQLTEERDPSLSIQEWMNNRTHNYSDVDDSLNISTTTWRNRTEEQKFTHTFNILTGQTSEANSLRDHFHDLTFDAASSYNVYDLPYLLMQAGLVSQSHINSTNSRFSHFGIGIKAEATFADEMEGGNGNDRMAGELGDDTINGGQGLDYIEGGAGDDHLNGDGDDDVIRGGYGNDTLRGGSGADVLEGGTGADIIDGNGTTTTDSQRDMVSYASSSAGVIVNLATGAVSGGDAEGDTLLNIEWAEGSQHDDTLIAKGDSNSPNGSELFGLGGDDNLQGGARMDFLYGGADNDTISGGGNSDYLEGGDGNDDLSGNAGSDVLVGGDGDDTYRWNNGDHDDVVSDSNGTDKIVLGAGIADAQVTLTQDDDDLIIHVNGADAFRVSSWFMNANSWIESIEIGGVAYAMDDAWLQSKGITIEASNSSSSGSGDSGAGGTATYVQSNYDTQAWATGDGLHLAGGATNDWLDGSGYNTASIRGNDGNDYIFAGSGDDWNLYGGAGADVFGFGAESGWDTLREFERGVDKIHLIGGVTFDDLEESSYQGDTWYQFEIPGTTAKLRFNDAAGFDAHSIDASDFVTSSDDGTGGSGDNGSGGTGSSTTISQSDYDQVLIGTSGPDQLVGTLAVRYWIDGGDGNDTLLKGSTQDDYIIGGAGGDWNIHGGEGNDIFEVRVGSEVDNIKDFVRGEDKIYVSGGFTYEQLTPSYHGHYVQYDLNATDRVRIFNNGGDTDITQIDSGDFIFALDTGTNSPTSPPAPPPSQQPQTSDYDTYRNFAAGENGTDQNDWIVGTNSTDAIQGGAGDDYIIAAGGSDTYIIGGAGADIFEYSAGDGTVHIHDFGKGGDAVFLTDMEESDFFAKAVNQYNNAIYISQSDADDRLIFKFSSQAEANAFDMADQLL